MNYVRPIKGKYMLFKIDYLSKMVELDVCLRANTKHTIAKIEKWERSKGLIEVLVKDGAKHFDNKDVGRWIRQ